MAFSKPRHRDMECETYKMIELSPREYFSRGSEPPSTSDNSDRSVKSSKFESLSDFETWLAKDGRRRLEEGDVGSIQSHIHASNATYTLEEASTPLKRWKCVIDDSPKRRRRRYYERECRRGKSSSEERESPKYFEPWYWKGTTRRPSRRRYPEEEYEDEGGSSSSAFAVVAVLAVFALVVVLLVKNKESVQDWFNLSQYFSNDFRAVKGRVEGEVKDMMASNLNDVSWRYEDQPETQEYAFEEAIEENDPAIIEHIKNFEEHLKKKPGKFFPAGRKTTFVPMKAGDNE